MTSDLEASEYRDLLDGKFSITLNTCQSLRQHRCKAKDARMVVLQECISLVCGYLNKGGVSQTLLVLDFTDSRDPSKAARFGQHVDAGFTAKVSKRGSPGGRLTLLPRAEPIVAKSGLYKVDVGTCTATYNVTFKRVTAIDIVTSTHVPIAAIQQDAPSTSNRKEYDTKLTCATALPCHLSAGKNVITISGFDREHLNGRFHVSRVASTTQFSILTRPIEAVATINEELQNGSRKAVVAQIYSQSKPNVEVYHICFITAGLQVSTSDSQQAASPGDGTSNATSFGLGHPQVCSAADLDSIRSRVERLEQQGTYQGDVLRNHGPLWDATVDTVDSLATRVDELHLDRMLRDAADKHFISGLDTSSGAGMAGECSSSQCLGEGGETSSWNPPPESRDCMDVDDASWDQQPQPTSTRQLDLHSALWHALSTHSNNGSESYLRLSTLLERINGFLNSTEATKAQANKILYSWAAQGLVERDGSRWRVKVQLQTTQGA